MTNDYQQEYLGSWRGPTAEERAAYEAAVEYEERCEAFDRACCRSADGLPRFPGEMGKCSRNANAVRRDVINKYSVPYHAFRLALKQVQQENRRCDG